MAGFWETINAAITEKPAAPVVQEKPVVKGPNERPVFAPVEHPGLTIKNHLGRPRLYPTNAERQRAYRQRMRAQGKVAP